jgi:hypothetical protein
MSNFKIGNNLSTAWHNVKGCKWPIWSPCLLTVAIIAGVTLILAIILALTLGSAATHLPHVAVSRAFLQIALILATLPLITGILMTALKKLRGETVDGVTGLQYWAKWWPLACGLLTVFVLNIAAFLVFGLIFGLLGLLVSHIIMLTCLIIFAAFLMPICSYLTQFLLISIADKDLGALSALAHSWELIKPHWLKIIGLFYAQHVLILLVLALPAGLGMLCPILAIKVLGIITSGVLGVWAIPYLILIFANAYKNLSSQ